MGEVDGTPGADDMPGRLTFHTSADGSDSPTERLRISSNGKAYFTPSEAGGFEAKWTDVDSAGPFGKFWNSDSVYGGGVQVKCNNARGGVEFLNTSGNNVAALYNSTGGWHWGGNLILDSGGIGFNDTATANHLDDYEEGSWTPTITFGGGSTGLTISKQTGYYVKIGRLVNVGGTLILSAKGSSTGNAALTVNGHLKADTKSFDIPHPIKKNMRLVHGTLEGPEFGMYQR